MKILSSKWYYLCNNLFNLTLLPAANSCNFSVSVKNHSFSVETFSHTKNFVSYNLIEFCNFFNPMNFKKVHRIKIYVNNLVNSLFYCRRSFYVDVAKSS